MPRLASPVARYVAAIGATAGAAALRAALTPLWGDQLPLATFYPAVVASAWLGGFSPGLVTTLSAAVAASLWLPLLERPGVGDGAALVLFLVFGLLTSWLVDSPRAARAFLPDRPRDVKDRARIDEREGEAQSRLAAIIRSSDDAIISKTLDGVITSWNRAATRMFGYAPEEVIGRPITIIIPEDRLSEEGAVLAAIRRGEAVEHFETVRRRKGGTFIDISLTVSPIRNIAGEIIGASKIARDISARRQADEERAALLAREQAARLDAEMANQAKDEFLAMLSHELRNPLGAISNAIYVLERSGAPGDSAAATRAVIARQTAHLSHLVDDLLRVGQVVTGKVTLDVKPVDLHELTERALVTLRETGRFEGRHVVLTGSSSWVQGDEVQIEQIVVNLVINALKFTSPGGSIRIRVAPEAGRAILRVADDGIGIDPALLARVFDLFVQGRMPVDRAQGGLGIGLTLVKRIAELHGGSVEAQSEGRGRGSTITVSLPAVTPPAAPIQAPAPVVHPSRRVLVVEDNDDARETLRIMLELWHHTVREATDGPGGIEAALEFKPEVALVDVGLPGLDGYEVARSLRAAGGTEGLRLIALTGYGLPQDVQRAHAAGFDAHLVKPIHPDRLREILSMDAGGPDTS